MDYLPYLLLVITLLIVGMQLWLYLSARSAQGKAPPPYDDLLGGEMGACRQLLFYFHSEHCGPCRQLTPLVEVLAQQRGCVVIVDVAHNMAAARRFGVRVTPTLMRIRGGLIDKVVVGGISEEKLARLLDEAS